MSDQSPEAVEVQQGLPFVADPTISHYAHRNAGGKVFVKTAEFYRTQGGVTMQWGASWIPLYECRNEDHARKAAEIIFDRYGNEPGVGEIDAVCRQLDVQEIDREVCSDCNRFKARNAGDAARGDCPKSWAINDDMAYQDCLKHSVPARPQLPHVISDGRINEITMDVLGKWPSFEAQSWACSVVHAVVASGALLDGEEDARVVKLACSATIRALGGDPDAFVTDYGQTVLDLTLYAIQKALAAEASR